MLESESQLAHPGGGILECFLGTPGTSQNTSRRSHRIHGCRPPFLCLLPRKHLLFIPPYGGNKQILVLNNKKDLVDWKIIVNFVLLNLKFGDMEQVGNRVVLLEMNEDPHPVPVGTKGTIYHIGGGVINVHWDNGRDLGLVKGFDKFSIIEND